MYTITFDCWVSHRGHTNFTNSQITFQIQALIVCKVMLALFLLRQKKNLLFVTDKMDLIRVSIFLFGEAATIVSIVLQCRQTRLYFCLSILSTLITNCEMHTTKCEHCIIVVLCHWKWQTCKLVECWIQHTVVQIQIQSKFILLLFFLLTIEWISSWIFCIKTKWFSKYE